MAERRVSPVHESPSKGPKLVRVYNWLSNGALLLAATFVAIHTALVDGGGGGGGDVAILGDGLGLFFRMVLFVASAGVAVPAMLALAALASTRKRPRQPWLLVVPAGVLWLAYGVVVLTEFFPLGLCLIAHGTLVLALLVRRRAP
jgi:hypothetical protein